MIRQFRERNFILSRYGASVYGFVHRAFLEFFCADYYVQQFEKLQELSIAQLKQQVFAAHWADPSWREVLRLISGRIADRFAGEVIRFLARDVYQPWPRQFGDRPPRNIALAVQCLGEVRSPNAIRGEAAELLGVIIELLEHSIGTQDHPRDVMLQEELVPAIQTVGMAWPGPAENTTSNGISKSARPIRRHRSRTSPPRLPACCFRTARACVKCWIGSPGPTMITGNARPR